ncbi:uncharacterized protein IWZ02DRAFT_74828 [Phyllosticta citriasiana]|uniref:BZIP domain-containing protein n=1 Tax=Phyllosticta citriasiana TaxID=595635 RepID=A0ABR1KU82_9PEZI
MAENINFNAYAYGVASDGDSSSFLNPFTQSPQALPSSLPAPQPFFDAASTASFDPTLQTVHPQALFSQPSGARSTSDESLLQSRSSSSSAPLPPHFGTAREQHGQYTPDSDITPKRDTQPRRLRSHTREGQTQGPDQDERVKDHSKKKRTSSVATSIASPEKKGSRKNSTANSSGELDTEEAPKREQFLERNRKAAHKCRQKKKDWEVNLDEKYRGMAAQNRMLQAEVDVLNGQVFALKNLVFQHSNCQFPPINAFIEAEASKVCARVSSTAGQSRPQSTTEPSVGPATGSKHFFGPGDAGTLEFSNMDAVSMSSGARSRSMTVEADPLRDDWGQVPPRL